MSVKEQIGTAKANIVIFLLFAMMMIFAPVSYAQCSNSHTLTLFQIWNHSADVATQIIPEIEEDNLSTEQWESVFWQSFSILGRSAALRQDSNCQDIDDVLDIFDDFFNTSALLAGYMIVPPNHLADAIIENGYLDDLITRWKWEKMLINITIAALDLTS